MLTGKDLNILRRSLVLTEASFAQYLGIKPHLIKQAEKLKKEEIVQDKFKPLLKALVKVGPQMIVARLHHMQEIGTLLKDASEKLKRSERWLRIEDQEDDDEIEIEEEEPKKDRRSAVDM